MVVVVVVKFRYWVGLWDAKYGHEEYHTKLFIVLENLYFTNNVFFYDCSIYNPTNTCVFNRLYTM